MSQVQATVLSDSASRVLDHSDLASSVLADHLVGQHNVGEFPQTDNRCSCCAEPRVSVGAREVELSELNQEVSPSCSKIENMRWWLRIVAALVTVACLSSDVVGGVCLVECERSAPKNTTQVAVPCHEAIPSGASSSVRRVAQCCHQPSELCASAGSPVTIALGKYLLAVLSVSDPRELPRKFVARDPSWHLTPPGPPDTSSYSPLRL
jgi:hypothetical protein